MDYIKYTYYLSGKCPSAGIGAERLRLTQGSFRSVSLFGAQTLKVQRRAADIMQPISCETILRQSPTGPRHDSAAGNRQWCFCCLA